MNLTPQLVRGFKIAYPSSLEREYAKQLTILTTQFQRLVSEHFKSADINSLINSSMRQDDVADDLDQLIKTLNLAISVEVIKVIGSLSKKFNTVRQFVDHSFKQSLIQLAGRLGTDNLIPLRQEVKSIDIKLLQKMWVEKNTQLIRDIPAKALIQINDAVCEAVRRGESIQSLSNRLHEIFEFTQKRAKRIARDQIAKLKGDISRHNDLLHGFTVYEWSSCKDGAVRKSHQVLEGKICSWLDSSVYKNKVNEKWKKRSSIKGVLKHVGEDIMCRCTNIILKEVEVGA